MKTTHSPFPTISLSMSDHQHGDMFHPQWIASMVQLTPHFTLDTEFQPIKAQALVHWIRLAVAAKEWWGDRFGGIELRNLSEAGLQLLHAVPRSGLLVPIPADESELPSLGATVRPFRSRRFVS